MTGWLSWSLADVRALFPELWLVTTGVILLLLDTLTTRFRRFYSWFAAAGIGGAWMSLQSVARTGAWGGTIDSSPLAIGVVQIGLVAAFLALLASPANLALRNLGGGEFFALVLWATCGISIMIRAREFLVLFVALEVLSVALYGLAAFDRRHDRSLEAGLKYFIMGAFVSAFLLYGIAILYGETGTTTFDGIGEALVTGAGSSGLILLGVLLVFSGFGFKLSWVPFHAWAPDVYQGAPSASVAYLAVAPKVAAAAVLVRWAQVTAPSSIQDASASLLSIFAVASMIVGTLFALVQRDLKRMLAYSGIAHMGYLAIPLVSPSAETWRAILVYLAGYVVINFAAFALVGALVREGHEGAPLSQISGLASQQPWLAACLAISMLSLAGIPPTLGFLGKYLVFLDAIQNGHLALALVGIATTLVGAVFYLRVIYFLYMKPQLEGTAGPLAVWEGRVVISIAIILAIVLGVWPQPLFAWITEIVASS